MQRDDHSWVWQIPLVLAVLGLVGMLMGVYVDQLQDPDQHYRGACDSVVYPGF